MHNPGLVNNGKKLKKGVSVIVCCYNSVDRLPMTLQHLALQKIPAHIPWEVIVVDNASKDNTAEIARQVWDKLDCDVPFRVVYEQTPGLNSAREKGFSEADYEYVLTCDDDNWLNESYVSIAYEVMNANDEIGALGGWGEPVCEVDPPNWFEKYAEYYATGKQGEQAGEITTSKAYVYGAGAIYRKAFIESAKARGFNHLLSDRIGNTLACGGDNEIGYSLVFTGKKIWFDDRLKFKHFIPKERLTWQYIEKLHAGYITTLPILAAYQQVLMARRPFKQAWQWLLLMRLWLLLKSDLLTLPTYLFNNHSHLRKFKLQYKIHWIYHFFKERKAYQRYLKLIKSMYHQLK